MSGVTALLVLAGSACAVERGESAFSGADGAATDSGAATGETTGGEDPGGGSAADGGDDGADPDEGDEGAIFDLPSGDADAGLPSDGCSKVDFLFIIDNSISMGDEQDNLAASFPSFISTIEQEVVSDYHVMVIDTDGEDKWDEELVECYSGDCDGEPADEPCGILPPENGWACGALPVPDACDAMLGAGVDHDGSDARVSCGLPDGQRWFSDTQPDVASTFGCMANLYDGNSPELTMGGMLSALSPAMNSAGGCNDGFLRDDAVLVVTFISDEEDDGDSIGSPQTWRDELLALKGGNDTAVVMLGLLGDTGLPSAVCPPDSVAGSNGGEYSPRLIEVVDGFAPRGVWGSVCAADYGPFFAEAVALIDTACTEFEPEG
ncbi:MAG: hypothetical protein AAF721_21635 [Myxococcota bacterium]